MSRLSAVGHAVVLAALAGYPVCRAADTPVKQQRVPATIDASGLRREVGLRAGKVVVVNFWATWCDPCKAEFPDLVRLAVAYHTKGMELLTVSFDDAPSVPKIVIPFLSKNHVSTGAFVNKTGSHFDDAYLRYLEPKLSADDAVGLPRTYIFNRKGALVKVLIGGQTYGAFRDAVKPYL